MLKNLYKCGLNNRVGNQFLNHCKGPDDLTNWVYDTVQNDFTNFCVYKYNELYNLMLTARTEGGEDPKVAAGHLTAMMNKGKDTFYILSSIFNLHTYIL